MTADDFLNEFGHFADAPNGIKKLRELILQLAVSGCIVEQREDDLSAWDCINDAAEAVVPTARNISEPIRLQWASIPLGAVVASNTGGGTPSKSTLHYWGGPIPWASVKDIQEPKYVTCTQDSITEAGLNNSSSNLIPPGRLIVVTRMGLGKLAINRIAIAINQDLRAIEPTQALDLDYAYNLFKSLKMVGKGVTVKGITVKELHSMPIALPPLAEQKRIVAKVDQLMKLCDELEAKQQERTTARTSLNNSCLNALTAPEEDQTKSWSRISNNFDLLYDTPETVAELRKSILQLAVMGRLVPQNPNDEPASELLKKIEAEKQRLVKDGKIKKQKPLPLVDPEQVPYELHKEWEWCRFGDVANIASNLVKPDAHQDSIHVAPNNIEKNTGRLLPCSTVAEDKVRSSNHLFHEGQILYSKIRPALNKVTIAEFDGLCSADMYPVDAYIHANFLMLYMLSNVFLLMAVATDTRVAMPKINQETLNLIYVATPPLAEQKRIVAKVDALMTLCDQLEAKLKQSQSASESLTASIVNHLTEAA